LEVKNGQTGYVREVAAGGALSVTMDNGKEVSVNPRTGYNYLSHGYALTDYKSQGQTEKHVIYHADTKKGVSYNQAYVGITRGKESVTIYTDNKVTLLEKMKKEQSNTSTLDYTLNKPQKSDTTEVGRTMPDKTPDAIVRFNKLAQTTMQQHKDSNEKIIDPTVVSKFDPLKVNDKALDKSIENVAVQQDKSGAKDTKEQAPDKETIKERNRSGFER
jgi:hypothetical protein